MARYQYRIIGFTFVIVVSFILGSLTRRFWNLTSHTWYGDWSFEGAVSFLIFFLLPGYLTLEICFRIGNFIGRRAYLKDAKHGIKRIDQ